MAFSLFRGKRSAGAEAEEKTAFPGRINLDGQVIKRELQEHTFQNVEITLTGVRRQRVITESCLLSEVYVSREADMKIVTESKIDGSFRGWTGRGVYKLTNGQVWEQVRYRYRYRYAYRPKARIWRDGSTHYLEVEGMDEMIEVRRGSSADLQDEEND